MTQLNNKNIFQFICLWYYQIFKNNLFKKNLKKKKRKETGKGETESAKASKEGNDVNLKVEELAGIDGHITLFGNK